MSIDEDDDAYILARLLLDDVEKTSGRHEPLYFELAAILKTVRESLVVDQAAIEQLVAEQIKAQAEKVNLEVVVREMVKQSVFEFVNELRRQVSNRVNQLVIEMVDREFKARIEQAEGNLRDRVRALVDVMLKNLGGRR